MTAPSDTKPIILNLLWIGDTDEQKKRAGEAFNQLNLTELKDSFEHVPRFIRSYSDLVGVVTSAKEKPFAKRIALIVINAHGDVEGGVHTGKGDDASLTALQLGHHLWTIRSNFNAENLPLTLVVFGHCYGHVTKGIVETADKKRSPLERGRLEFRAFTDDGKTSTYSIEQPGELFESVHKELTEFLKNCSLQ